MCFVSIWLQCNACWRSSVSPQVIFGCVFLPSLQILCKHVILATAVFGAFLPHSGPTVVSTHIVQPRPHEGAILPSLLAGFSQYTPVGENGVGCHSH